MLGALVAVKVALVCERLFVHTMASRDIAWETAATVLGVLGALVVVEDALSCECLVTHTGAAKNVARKVAASSLGIVLGVLYALAVLKLAL